MGYSVEIFDSLYLHTTEELNNGRDYIYLYFDTIEFKISFEMDGDSIKSYKLCFVRGLEPEHSKKLFNNELYDRVVNSLSEAMEHVQEVWNQSIEYDSIHKTERDWDLYNKDARF